jgi:hypothetical protein
VTKPEVHHAASKPERRPFQYSLRAIFGLTFATAVFFSVAATLGYADAVVALVASLILVGVLVFPCRVHPVTGILLTLVAGILLWAGWETEFNELPPEQLNLVPKSMFYRGWPLSPWMICSVHMMQFYANDTEAYVALIADGVAFAAALFVTRGVCGLCFRRRSRPVPGEPQSQSGLLPDGCAGRPGDG